MNHKLVRFTYAPMTQRTSYVIQQTLAYTTEEELEQFVRDHLICGICRDDLTREIDPEDPYDYKPETVWETGCMCEWDIEEIKPSDLYLESFTSFFKPLDDADSINALDSQPQR